MTETQKKIMAYIRRYYKRYGHAPTQREIAGSIGRAVSTTSQAIAGLEAIGKLSRQSTHSPNTGKGRTISLPGSDFNSRRVDL